MIGRASARRERRGISSATLPARWTVALAVAVSAAAPGPARGQEAPGRGLTVEEAVDVALENSPAYVQQARQLEAAEYDERTSFGQLLPTLSGSLGFSGGWARNKTAEDDFGRPIGGTEFIESTSSSASQSLRGGVTLFDLQQIREYGAARARTDAREAEADASAAELRTRVAQAYYQAVQRERLVEVEERSLATARDQLEAVRRLLRIAAKQPTDVLGAELDVAQAEQQLRLARGERRKAGLTLREAMGVSLEVAFELLSDFRAVFDPSGLELGTLIDRATTQSPSLAQSEAAVVAAERSWGAARAARYPQVTGNYSYGRGTRAEGYSAFGAFDLPNQNWGFGLSVSVPLFQGFAVSSQVGQARVRAEVAREALRQTRLQVEREVRSALIDLESAYGSVRTAETSADLARRRLEQGQESYRLGSTDYTALQQMIAGVASAERQLINAYYQFAVALLTLEEKVGGTVGG